MLVSDGNRCHYVHVYTAYLHIMARLTSGFAIFQFWQVCTSCHQCCHFILHVHRLSLPCVCSSMMLLLHKHAAVTSSHKSTLFSAFYTFCERVGSVYCSVHIPQPVCTKKSKNNCLEKGVRAFGQQSPLPKNYTFSHFLGLVLLYIFIYLLHAMQS